MRDILEDIRSDLRFAYSRFETMVPGTRIWYGDFTGEIDDTIRAGILTSIQNRLDVLEEWFAEPWTDQEAADIQSMGVEWSRQQWAARLLRPDDWRGCPLPMMEIPKRR